MSVGHKTNGELEFLASKYGWDKKAKLTHARIQRMTADEADYQSRFNVEEFNRAWNEKETEAENKRNAEVAQVRRMWEQDEATQEETETAVKEAKEFTAAHPQYIVCDENARTLLAWLKERKLLPTAQNWAAAFQAVGAQGRILVNPSALGIGTDTEVGGARLKHHPELSRLLEQAPNAEQKAKIAEQKMGSKEYRELHKEDFREDRISTRQRESWNKAIAFCLQSHPEIKSSDANVKLIGEAVLSSGMQMNPQGLAAAINMLKSKNSLELNEGAVQEGQALRYTNLANTGADVRNGFVANDTNLAAKIAKMSSAEYNDWLRSPSNRKAADALAAGIR
jgi:hypothetical protein